MSLRLPCNTRVVRLSERHSSARSSRYDPASTRTRTIEVVTSPFITQSLLDATTNPNSMPTRRSPLRASGVQSTYAVEPAA